MKSALYHQLDNYAPLAATKENGSLSDFWQ